MSPCLPSHSTWTRRLSTRHSPAVLVPRSENFRPDQGRVHGFSLYQVVPLPGYEVFPVIRLPLSDNCPFLLMILNFLH